MGIRGARTARPSRDLERARDFYERLVGLPVLWTFEDHDGFDGVVFGLPDERAQLELVSPPGEVVLAPSVEDLVVLYLDDATAKEVVDRLRSAGQPEVVADDAELNPFWPRHGAVVFVDPDGYRLVLLGLTD